MERWLAYGSSSRLSSGYARDKVRAVMHPSPDQSPCRYQSHRRWGKRNPKQKTQNRLAFNNNRKHTVESILDILKIVKGFRRLHPLLASKQKAVHVRRELNLYGLEKLKWW